MGSCDHLRVKGGGGGGALTHQASIFRYLYIDFITILLQSVLFMILSRFKLDNISNAMFNLPLYECILRIWPWKAVMFVLQCNK